MLPIYPGRGASWPAAATPGPAAPDTAGELVTELSSFTGFRDRIDELLRDLRASPAAPRRLGEDPVSRGRFGGGTGSWSEADALHGSYRAVVGELERLSQLLSDSMEGMGTAVLDSHRGYAHTDTDVRDRMLTVRSEEGAAPWARTSTA
ncbi:hypothetical protein ACIQOF_00430 [Streptomyces sp. NPDC091265]|uniref:hypothetical protein n=1 Tax=unclassified Streptomyces TaxID=2593676 RepID=UPI00344B8701